MTSPPRSLRHMHFTNERLSHVGLQVLTLAQLRTSPMAAVLASPERITFCMVLVVTAGQGEHVVDFQRIALEPGVVVFVRPGEVHQWCLRPGLEGDVLLVAPHVMQPQGKASVGVTPHALALDDWPAWFTLSVHARRHWRALRTMLRRELAQAVIDELSVSLAHQLYRCLLLWLTRAARPNLAPQTPQELLYRQLQRELDAQVATRPSVEALAQSLRVSPTTLNRTCHAKAGRSAKAVIDLRIALEAQRMLVHSGETSVAIGDQLGFSEPTNFLKFFKRQSGMTPEAFRARHRVG